MYPPPATSLSVSARARCNRRLRVLRSDLAVTAWTQRAHRLRMATAKRGSARGRALWKRRAVRTVAMVWCGPFAERAQCVRAAEQLSKKAPPAPHPICVSKRSDPRSACSSHSVATAPCASLLSWDAPYVPLVNGRLGPHHGREHASLGARVAWSWRTGRSEAPARTRRCDVLRGRFACSSVHARRALASRRKGGRGGRRGITRTHLGAEVDR